jgi:hypothetical protein
VRQAYLKTALVALIALAFLALAGSAGAAEEFDKYGLKSAGVSLSSKQAGAHADMTISFALTEDESEHRPYARTRDLHFSLPPGVIGNPQNYPRCSIAQFGTEAKTSECPQDAQVGVTEITLHELGTLIEPVYNMYSPGGDIVARFGFYAGLYPAVINVRVNPTDYSLTASVEGASAAAEVISAKTTLWGVPAADIHDELRLTPAEAAVKKLPVGGRPSGQPEAPFLSNPTDCSLARQITATAVSYQLPGQPSTLLAPYPQITGCEKLSFKPTFAAVPTSSEAFAPTGLDATLRVPQDETPQGLATSTLKKAVVTLPEGLVINPAAGEGLGACSSEQVGFGTANPSACPDAAKIGSVELEVPALEDTLHGAVYQRTPEGDQLFRFWLVTDEQGVHLKLPAEIQANPLTGQLTTVFAGIPLLGGNPQVPFSELRLHVFGGPRAPLATPGCGTYSTHYEFSPWSGRPAAIGEAAMAIASGCDKGGFSPHLKAGSLSTDAGKFAPFSFTLTRDDGEANPETLAVHLPQGLLAKLGGVPRCPEAAIPTGECPGGSRIGQITAAAGVGGAPLWLPQSGKSPTAAYLAGPYKGAPFSIVSVVPAQAGPFDLGTVVNRAAIRVEPETALATIKTDPLPQILKGVPVAYRAIHVDIDRKDFTINPTDCSAKKIRATVTASNGATASPEVGYQATNCAKLAYRPKLRLTFAGQTKRTGHPSIRAVLTQKPHQANTQAATVVLPAGQLIDNAHINTPCTRVQFDAGNCPKKSILGYATARTPLLDEPLKGPVYFRSNGGARVLPDLVADLRGQIEVALVGYIDSVPSGRGTSRVRTRFLHVPDAPVTRFTMKLFGGRRGLIINSRDLCKGKKQRAEVDLSAQNGRVLSSRPVLATGCGR